MKNYSLIFFLCILNSCANQSFSILQNSVRQPKHAVQSERLQRLMNQINDLMYERMLTAPEIDSQRRIRTEEMAQTASNLVQTVQEIPKHLPSLPLSPDEQIVFLHLSKKLKDQAQLLKQEAEGNRIDIIPERLNQIDAVCTQCHRLFRQFPKE